MDETDTLSPLYVDLDGTLIKSDMLLENIITAVKTNPLIIFYLIPWLLKGKHVLKKNISEKANTNHHVIPLNKTFFNYLTQERAKGREIILATASSEKDAKSFIEKYPVFSSFISSDDNINLKGENKLLKIQNQSQTFSYAGNDTEDFDIFPHAEQKILVNPTRKARSLASNVKIDSTYDESFPTFKIWAKQLRLYQASKNTLIFIPLLVSGLFQQWQYIFISLSGFISFTSLASATYIINDLLDLEADRTHKKKKYRPIAAGQISIRSSIFMAGSLFILSFAIASSIEGSFIYILLAYLLITLSYSFKIKQYIGIDVITLAALYTIRILAGAMLINVTVSFWLFSFSMFIFFSLALIKRCAELKALEQQNKAKTTGRNYDINDYNVLMSFGTTSALLSIVMFTFYANNNILTNQYQDPSLLWLIIPALGYWLMRMWIKTNRGEMHHDPIIFSLKDKGSLLTIITIIILTILAQAL